MQTLTAGCAQPLPPRAVEAIRLFNAGEYYRQHDLLEELWRETEGPIRDLYRAVLQGRDRLLSGAPGEPSRSVEDAPAQPAVA